MKTNVLVPFIQLENTTQVYLNGRVFEINETEVSEIENITEINLRNAINAFETFEFTSNSINWYNGSATFSYSLNEGTFNHNSMIIEGNTFTDHVLAAGTVRYENKAKAELFESIPSLLQNFVVLDIVACFEGNNNTVDLFKLDQNVYVSRFNTVNRIAKFFKADGADSAIQYVKEQTSQDATEFLSDLLETEEVEAGENQQLIEKYQDVVDFLKDQRGLLAEADKTIEEIKAADSLINGEIREWESKIKALNA